MFRLEQDACGKDDPAVFNSVENKSNCFSRMAENFAKESTNSSIDKTGLDQFYLYRRKRKPSIVGEDKFNKLSDEIILMILKWLPKKCLVRVTIESLNCSIRENCRRYLRPIII